MDDIRNPEVWQLTKEAMQKGGVFSLDNVGLIARYYVSEITSRALGATFRNLGVRTGVAIAVRHDHALAKLNR